MVGNFDGILVGDNDGECVGELDGWFVDGDNVGVYEGVMLGDDVTPMLGANDNVGDVVGDLLRNERHWGSFGELQVIFPSKWMTNWVSHEVGDWG